MHTAKSSFMLFLPVLPVSSMPEFLTAALYKFVELPDFAELQAPLLDCCELHGVKGTLLLALEGINGTIAGRAESVHAVLAHLPRETQIRLLEAVPRRKLTPMTLTRLDALLVRLDQVRRSGFALSDQENVTGLRVLAAPVLDADGIPFAALSVAAPAFAMPLKSFAANRKPVMAAAAKLSRAIQAAGAGVSPAKLGQLGT